MSVLSVPGHRSHDARRHANEPSLEVTLDHFAETLDFLEANDLRHYRIPDGFVPYGTHPDLPRFHGQVERCAEALAQVGERVRAGGIRLGNHPGQYTVLNSEREDVRDKAIADLEQAAALFDAMGLGPEAVVVLHVGGAAGGLEAAGDRFVAGAELLSEAARARLVVEHDDRVWGLSDVLPVAERAGLRVVFDNLHHFCLDREGIPEREAVALAAATWPADHVPKVHVSSARGHVEERGAKLPPKLPPTSAHADLIEPMGLLAFLRDSLHPIGRDIDVMVEAKAKDLAVLRLRDQLAAHGVPWVDGAAVVG
ncbi:MAG: UV-endonuclease UvdE [Thermoleophilia bacterium]|nr:UV-endonuclease UvdE [Thermoleophilia bacterium]